MKLSKANKIEACVGTCTTTSPVAVPNAGLASVTVTNAGTNYTYAPIVQISAPPAGGVSTVRGITSFGSHSSTLTITQIAMRAPPGNFSAGRSVIAE